jgi:acetoacetate decarboxylase
MHLRSAAGRALSKTARNSYEQPGSLLFSATHADQKPRACEADNQHLADILLQKTAKTASRLCCAPQK